MIIKNDRGRQFFVRVVFTGDRYGLDDCLVHVKPEPVVEFFDWTYAGPNFGPRGQFVSRYYVKTLSNVEGGLSLDGGVPEWTLDAACVRPVVEMAALLAAAQVSPPAA